MSSEKCPYCHRNMEEQDGYWYCKHCNYGLDFPEDYNDDYCEIDESSGSEDYFSSRPWTNE